MMATARGALSVTPTTACHIWLGTIGHTDATPSAGFPFAPGGYYDVFPSGCGRGNAWPKLRVHATGGFDLITGAPILIDPANQATAQVSNLLDAGLGSPTTGLFAAPPGDGMLHWSRADFVRRLSTATFGFFDTLQPQRSLTNGTALAGFPDWLGVDPTLRPSDLVVQLDPPATRQPGGTSVVVELRGAESFGNAQTIYDPLGDDGFDTRGNLLNPNYACEAYRYSTANSFGAPRVPATGLTRYADSEQLSLIRDPVTGRLPRHLNLRVVMTNKVDVTPTLSPSLRSMSVVYRLTQ